MIGEVEGDMPPPVKEEGVVTSGDEAAELEEALDMDIDLCLF